MVCQVCSYKQYIKFITFSNKNCDYNTFLSFCKCECVHDMVTPVNNKQFNDKWKTLTVVEKLETYSKDKLLVLCRNKGFKIRNTVRKHEVIEILKPVVVASDFPIISKRLKDKLIS